MIESIVILHGLFLLNCSSKPTQSCQILVADTPPHLYAVGTGLIRSPLPADRRMRLVFEGTSALKQQSARKLINPGGHTLDLNPRATDVLPDKARSVITVESIPEELWGMNRVEVDRDSILNGTADEVILTEKARVVVSESLVLSFGRRGKITLVDGQGNEVASSSEVKGKAVLPVYSILSGGDHAKHADPFNSILTSSYPLMLRLGGVKGVYQTDEAASPVADMPPDITRIPGMWSVTPRKEMKPDKKTGVLKQPGTIVVYTADQTGCGVVVRFGS